MMLTLLTCDVFPQGGVIAEHGKMSGRRGLPTVPHRKFRESDVMWYGGGAMEEGGKRKEGEKGEKGDGGTFITYGV